MLGIGLGVLKNSRVGSSGTLSFNFVNSLPPGSVFTRASAAWIQDTDLDTVRVESGSPCFEHFKGFGGVRLEDASTNLILQSAVSSNAWGAVRVTFGERTTERSQHVQEVIVSSDAANTHISGLTIFATTSGDHYSHSMILKEGAGVDQNGWVFLDTNAGGAGRRAFFNILSGTIGSAHADFDSHMIQDLSSGWYRCSVSIFATTSTNISYNVGIANVDNVNFWDGDTDRRILAMHAQLEISDQPTSIIITSGSAVTRAADTLTNTTVVDSILLTEGVLFAKFASRIGEVNGEKPIFSLEHGTDDYIQAVLNPTASDWRFRVASGATVQASADTGAAVFPFTGYDCAVGYEANSFAGRFFGEATLTDVAGTVPTSIDTLRFGMAGSARLNGWISGLEYVDNRLANSAIEFKVHS